VHNRFSEHIKKAKEDHWTQWLDTLTSTGMWNFHRYATSNLTEQFHTHIQTLQDQQCEQNNDQIQDNARKSKILYETFFCPPSENDFVDPNYTYEPPICEFKLITNQQINHLIVKLSPFKAPGPNKISNIVFMKCTSLLIPFLGPIFCGVTITLALGGYQRLHSLFPW
jgi:hypothetical protein